MILQYKAKTDFLLVFPDMKRAKSNQNITTKNTIKIEKQNSQNKLTKNDLKFETKCKEKNL